ncbi:NAD-dependent epimerase/dehydratase family protein [Lacimicrobium alkaliphilum]|uniref:NAD(P)-dependent oxidoreductase n=1 Tax=Lacimicrobium alkaliphilum TaxID=1526571 RepID=A0ABQ1R7V4_9ALTE|nr:NAD-dependent epimerase/dehydratase family protein [Lacimicrobium alkaliphilum]GGD59063.1 NAD(P)-dependent oxidoreductase [Lacimicrobium alkaliphilum]
MTNISICGCGWLGEPLAYMFLQQGFRVMGTCRSQQKRDQLQQKGINARQFELGHPMPTDIFHQSTLILNLPPGQYRQQPEFFVNKILYLIETAKLHGCQNILFISTTSVYGDSRGRVTEHSQLKPVTSSAKAHVQIEQAILAANGTVLRLAGLIGPGRHPARNLAGRKQISGGANPVNLVHQEDVINAVITIIKQQVWGKVLHLAATEHPSRADYYRWAAGEAGLAPPEFKPDNGGDSKVIDATATLSMLNLELAYPSPFQMPVS